MKKKKTKKAESAARLARETAAGGMVGVRQGWDSSSVAPALDPRRLAQLLASARDGEAHDYLTLAAEMEERDIYYRSLLSTRKLAVQGLEPTVTPGGDDPASIDLADAVRRDIVDRPEFTPMLYDALDAIAKGYAAIEILWDTAAAPWRPAAYRWRDPRWFRYDRAAGVELRLLDDADPVDGVELDASKWIVHEPQLKSGLAVRGGLALPIAYYYLVKAFDVASWIAFVETFGYPIRLGKYGKDAAEEDIAVLKRAVANLGRDVGATIPDSMTMEIVAGVQQGASVSYYERLGDWTNRQIAIGVLGQAATTEGTPGKLGADDAQQEVRRDILRSDARQLAATLQRDLIEPYVRLNYGRPPSLPQFRFTVEEPEDIEALVDSVVKLAPLGFRVRKRDLYARLRLTEPADGDDVLEPPPAPAPPASAPPDAALQAALTRAGLNARRGAGADADTDEDDDLDELSEAQEWEPVTRPLHDAVQTWAAGMGSLDEAQRRLPELLQALNSQRFAERLAADLLRARGIGDLRFDGGRTA